MLNLDGGRRGGGILCGAKCLGTWMALRASRRLLSERVMLVSWLPMASC